MAEIAPTEEFRVAALATLVKNEDQNYDSLESHLRSLWAVVNKYKNSQPSYSLFARLIDETFETTPVSFDEQWLSYEQYAFWDYENESLVIKAYQNGEWQVVQKDLGDFEILKRTLLHQIVDFRKLHPEKLQDNQSFFGLDSGTGKTWYNFTPVDYWSCAIRGMEDHLSSPASLYAIRFRNCTWASFAALLGLGQSYE